MSREYDAMMDRLREDEGIAKHGAGDDEHYTVEVKGQSFVVYDLELARLFNAAPELLAALRESLHDALCHPSEGRHSARCKRAKAAIRKATGG